MEKELVDIQVLYEFTVRYEIISYHLTQALAHFAELTGKSISEQGMDAVLKNFVSVNSSTSGSAFMKKILIFSSIGGGGQMSAVRALQSC